jgi:hypothetical protein
MASSEWSAGTFVVLPVAQRHGVSRGTPIAGNLLAELRSLGGKPSTE